jgi:hypothetical protein
MLAGGTRALDRHDGLEHAATPYGHLTEDGEAMSDRRLATLIGRPLREIRNALDELERHRVFSRTDDGVIFSRGMVRDHAKSQKCSVAGKAGVQAKASRILRGPPPVPPMQGADKGRPGWSAAPVPVLQGNKTSQMAAAKQPSTSGAIDLPRVERCSELATAINQSTSPVPTGSPAQEMLQRSTSQSGPTSPAASTETNLRKGSERDQGGPEQRVPHHAPGRGAGPTPTEPQTKPVTANTQPQAPPAAAATPALPGAEADPVEWKILKDQIFAVYSRYGLMPDFGTVDVWRTQHQLDPKLIWLLIGYPLEQRIRLDPMTSLQHFTPMVTREAVARDFRAGAPTVTTGLAPPVNGANLVAPQINGSPTWKVALPDRYLKGPKGAIIAAEDVPPEDWIILARNWREHGQWPPTLGPPPGKPGSSCPPDFAREA